METPRCGIATTPGIPAVLVCIVYFAAVLTVLFIFGSNRMSVLYAALQLILRPALLMGIILFNTGIVLLAVKCFVRYFRGKRSA